MPLGLAARIWWHLVWESMYLPKKRTLWSSSGCCTACLVCHVPVCVQTSSSLPSIKLTRETRAWGGEEMAASALYPPSVYLNFGRPQLELQVQLTCDLVVQGAEEGDYGVLAV